MRNILVIDGAENCVYDIFSATDDEFSLIFPNDTDVAFIDEVYSKNSSQELDSVFVKIWQRRCKKADVQGIHGTLFYELEFKKPYYPTRKDEEAIALNGATLRVKREI